MAATLATDAQILLSIGANASAAQILNTNTDIGGGRAEADRERASGDNVGLVENYAGITAALKQWLAGICADRAAWRAINQDQNIWQLATTQSKLNVLNATWKGFLSDLTKNKADIIADLNL